MEHQSTVVSGKSGGNVADTSAALGKSDSRYWTSRLEHPACTKDGQRRQSPDWAVRVMYQGRREYFNLGTANKAAAAKKAVAVWTSLQANGWADTLGRFKRQEPERPQRVATVGELLEAVKGSAVLRPKTFADYARALRLIVAGVAKVAAEQGKFAARGVKRRDWLGSIHAVPLSELTLDRVQRWKLEFLNKAGTNPAKRQSRVRSVNSTLRQAKNLFSLKRLKFINLLLPSPLPFDGIEFEKEGSCRYVSRFDVRQIIQAARNELSETRRWELMALLLAVCAGLRRNEIDKLEWNAVDFVSNTISVGVTDFLSPKPGDSAGEITVDQEFMELFAGFKAAAKGRFVIESDRQPSMGTAYTTYRCNEHFEALVGWLRSKGVSDKKPLHALRKEFGSLINEQHGIYAASRALRHADIGITARHYVDNRKRVTPGLGGLLKLVVK